MLTECLTDSLIDGLIIMIDWLFHWLIYWTVFNTLIFQINLEAMATQKTATKKAIIFQICMHSNFPPPPPPKKLFSFNKHLFLFDVTMFHLTHECSKMWLIL